MIPREEESTDKSAIWKEDAEFYSDEDYNNFFKRWHGWIGGDIGISTLLNDGKTVWVWGDSYTGIVESKRIRRSVNMQFERNFMIVQDGENFSSFRLVNEGSPDGGANDLKIQDIAVPTDDDGNLLAKHDVWYWPSGSAVYFRNGIPELQMILSRVKNNESVEGMWGMIDEAADVAVFSLPDLKLQRIEKFKHYSLGKPVNYAGQVFKDDDGTVYIYGQGRLEGICRRGTFIARVKDGDLSKKWEFYNAQTRIWSADISWQNDSEWAKAAIAEEPLFVFKDANKYYAFELPTTCFGRDVFIFDAKTPWGPFANKRLVGILPKEISDLGSTGFFCSLPAIHQQHSKNGELMFSVSKNYDEEVVKKLGLPKVPYFDEEGCADTYLPYFFRVKNWREKLSISDLDITDNNGELTSEDHEDIEKLVDNDENTIYSTPRNNTWIEYKSSSPVRLRRYTVTSTLNSEEKDPKHWKIYGSNDGEIWTLLDERYNAEFQHRHETVSYVVPIDEEFSCFRFEVLDSKGNNGLEIAEWQLFGFTYTH